ncbi:Altered inheritance of mitochondria protein 9, mitochondrial [Tolypocladium ophioglossoides CBS 100239]|uniref:Altered inheritance of mitochondria protein 9, mitochondrial n=1 Tax=Tolypocladium ophioglossoides (strain CBS 100239) TaxID=1163406 RepID=A0A0L0MWG8_TOLOC|nr:Altered inheritance of mitochondria protein 9, mitochondrial [Tolypocladium ophioglossoides CBS 100239]
MDKTSSLAVLYDGLCYAEGDDKYRDWDNNFKEKYQRPLEQFVTNHVSGRGLARFVGISDGSYNRVVRFTFDSGGSDVALKCPKPGHSAAALVAEKIANEASWIEFLGEITSIPVPHVYSYGTEPDHLSPLELPYILMDWVPGNNLRDFLATGPSDELRSTIYQQIAAFHLELYHLPCEGIGSVVKDSATTRWSIRRPLTIDMHQLAIGVSNYPTDDWPTEMFISAADYFEFIAKQQSNQLWNLRNLNAPPEQEAKYHNPKEIARLRYEARYRFKQFFKVTRFWPQRDNFGPFRPFNPDLDTRNMTVDPQTGKIVGVFDLEFTNAMPTQFSCDPPLSLFKVLPGDALDTGYFAWFLQEYEPILEQFLDAMRYEEQKRRMDRVELTPLSTLMRDSWTTKRVWFNYGLTHSDHVDAIYWAVLHELYPDGVAPELPPEVKAEMEQYVQRTKSKLVEYDNAWQSYFRKQYNNESVVLLGDSREEASEAE